MRPYYGVQLPESVAMGKPGRLARAYEAAPTARCRLCGHEKQAHGRIGYLCPPRRSFEPWREPGGMFEPTEEER